MPELPPVRLGRSGPVVGHVTGYDVDTGRIEMRIDDDHAARLIRGDQLDGLSIGTDPPVTVGDVVPQWHDTDITDDLTRLTPRPIPEALRALADKIEAKECTGVAARWCPVHGTCTCRDRDDLNDYDCPLHSTTSSHAARRV